MAKRSYKKKTLEDTTAKTTISDFIEVTVDPNQVDLEELIEQETQPFTEEERVGVVKEPAQAQFKDPDKRVNVKGMVMAITNDNLTEKLKNMLINDGMSEDEFI